MNRLLIRILAGVFLTMLAGAGLRIVLFAHLYGNFFADPAWYPVHSTAELIVDIIDHTPFQKIYQERDFLSAALNRQVDILAVEDADVPEKIRQQVSAGKLTYGLFAGGKKRFYAPVHDGTHLVVFDPAFQSYRPTLPPSDYAAAFVWVSVVAAIIGFLLAFPLNRRLNDLEDTVEKIRRGETSARAQNTSSDLIGSIGRCFNQMADRIQLMISNQRNLLTAAAHKFQAATFQISGLMNELTGDKSMSGIGSRAQKIDDVIEDLDQFVNDLLLYEKSIASGEGSAAGEAEPPGTGSHATQSMLRTGIRKFFIRTSLGILIALSFTHFFGLFMSQIGYRTISFDPNWYPLRTTAALIQRAADTMPREVLPKRLETLRAILGKRIDFLPAGMPAVAQAVLIGSSDNISYGVYNGRKVYFAPVQSGTLIIDLDIHRYRRNPSLLFHVSVLPAQFMFIILGSMLLCLPIIKNLKKLEAGIQSIRKGDLTARVDVPWHKPVGQLAGCFNEMAERVQSLLIQQQHLVQAVAHEIRTPVSRIRFHLEEMVTEADGFPDVDQEISDIMEEIEELNLLTNELQTFTTIDAFHEILEKASIPLHDILAEIVVYFQKAHVPLSFVLINPAEKDLTVTAHPVYFKRAVQNILSNAIRYARNNVFIHYHAAEGGIFIDIGDDGPGIPMTARETVFDPFIRLDGSRNRNTGGFGLGLAIVQRILSLHGGSVSITDNTPCGTIMTTFWPHPTPPATHRL